MIRLFLAGCLVFLSALTGLAGVTTWRVNQTDGDDAAAAADATGRTPFATIQAAVAAARANDVIRIDPGVYRETPIVNNGTSRLVINKVLTLEATGSCAETVIEGAWDPSDAATGLGANAIRCIYACAAATVRGLTLRNGATPDGKDTTATSGGGVLVDSSSTSFYLVDCVVENCSSTRGGGMRRGKAVRTVFRNCYANTYGAAAREASLYFCLVEGSTGKYTLAYAGDVVHCTFVENTAANSLVHFNKAGTVRNCLVQSGNSSIGTGTSGSTLSWDGCAAYGNLSYAADNCTLNVFGGGVFASIARDWHPLASGAIVGQANVEAQDKVPAAYRDVDIEGRPISWTAGELTPGAYQTVKTPASGLSQFSSTTDVRLTVDGVEIPQGGTNFLYDACWPTQHLVKAEYTGSAGLEVARMDFYPNGSSSSDQASRPPMTTNNEVWVTAPPIGSSGKWVPYKASCRWVDCQAVYEGEPDGSPERPFRDIQSAVTNTASVRTIKVRAGVYDSGEGTSRLGGVRNRVEYNNDGFLRLMAVDGPEKTFIVGAADPDAAAEEEGCGPNALRCIATGNNCVIQGFTLTGGHTDCNAEGGARNWGGAAYVSAGTAFYYDCIFSNNVARYTAVVNAGRLIRCHVTKNRSLLGSAVAGSTDFPVIAANCVFNGNRCANGVLNGKSVTIYNCTLVEDDPDQGSPFNDGPSIFYSIISSLKKPGSATRGYGSIIDGFTLSQDEFQTADPCFHDRAGGDWRVASVSIAVGWKDGGIANWWRYAGADFEGNRHRFVNGKVTSGAYQTVLPSVRIGVSSGDATDVSPNGVVFAEGRASVELTATAAARRLYEGFRVNGELVPGSGASATWTYVFPSDAVGETATASYRTDWYVDPSMSDANTGASPATAKRTLEKALENVVAGDTVHLAEGEYAEGSMLQETPIVSCTPYLRSRAVVPPRVTLVADGARARTVILGASSTGEGTDANGCGPNAIRCLLLGSQARVKGVTLRGGRTDCVNKEDDNNQGGGVLTLSGANPGLIEDCAIEDCCSLRGGGAYNGTFCRCRFVGNKATRNCAAGRAGRYFGCFFDRNYGQEVVGYYIRVSGCTFGAGNKAADGVNNSHAVGAVSSPSVTHACYNTLFCDFVTASASTSKKILLVNCAVYDGVPLPPDSVLSNCVTAAKTDLLRLDENGVPIAGKNPACDEGDLELWKTAMEAAASTEGYLIDAAGQPRIANAAIDIGCYEADWKSRYALKLGRRRCLTFTEASPLAHEETNGEVFLPTGALVGQLTVQADADYTFPVRMTGTGTLTVTIGSETQTFTGPSDEVTFGGTWTAAATLPISISYEPGTDDAGGAYLARGGHRSGMALLLR